MNIVVDASSLIAVVTNEAQKGWLIDQTQSRELMAPISVHFEVGNAFSAMLKRRRVTVEQCLAAIKTYGAIPIRFVDVELASALQIAALLDIYAYDAYLIRCAEKFQAPLLTLDQPLRTKARAYGIQIMEPEQ
jgi:predicted nucleic acid-binding protein